MTSALLLSGGMDSVALAYWKRPTLAITVDYGQKPARAEVQAAAEVCKDLELRHEVIRVDCSSLGSGDLAGSTPSRLAPVPEWWPYRNQLLVTLAAARIIDQGLSTLLLGTVNGDRAHVDGSPAFIAALSSIMAMQEGGLRIEAPAIEMSSVALIKASGVPLEVLAWAHSCHVADLACGYCRGCAKHFATTKELGIGPY